MIDTLITYSGYLATIFVVILFHEAGHYFAARLFCLHVDKFYVFLNPWFTPVKFTAKETQWGIGWLPVGGYVAIDPHLDYKPKRQQIFFYLSGVLGNLFLADNILIFIDYLPFKVWFMQTAIWSTALAAINLLPFKGMDGSHIYKLITK